MTTTNFLVNPQISWVWADFMVDLVPTSAALAPQRQDGKYVITPPAKFQPTPGQCIAVTGFACWAASRTNVGLSTEFVTLISPALGNGFFQFEPRLGSLNAFTVAYDHPGMASASVADNADRKQFGGISVITDDPASLVEMAKQSPPMFLVTDSAPLNWLFSIIQNSVATSLPGRYAIGGATAILPVPPLRRVDYAGVTVVGMQMAKAYYDNEVRKLDR
jgi:hypothetical protein